MTYIKRTYFPFVLREPQLWSAGGRVNGALWAYADPATAVRPACMYGRLSASRAGSGLRCGQVCHSASGCVSTDCVQLVRLCIKHG